MRGRHQPTGGTEVVAVCKLPQLIRQEPRIRRQAGALVMAHKRQLFVHVA